MNHSNIIQINMGRIGISAKGETLKSILGSCVGIGLLWPDKNLYGLAHCLLPKAPENNEAKEEAKFVDQAVQALIEKMEIQNKHKSSISAIIAGGASLIKDTVHESTSHIGKDNIYAARTALKFFRLKIIFEDCGKNYGRQIVILGNGDFEVNKIIQEPL
jgi:chemotaxis protein CheD